MRTGKVTGMKSSRIGEQQDVSERPAQMPGIHFLGATQGSAFEAQTWLIEYDGLYIHLSSLLYRMLELADGSATLEDIARTLSTEMQLALSVSDVRDCITQRLLPFELIRWVAADSLSSPRAARFRPAHGLLGQTPSIAASLVAAIISTLHIFLSRVAAVPGRARALLASRHAPSLSVAIRRARQAVRRVGTTSLARLAILAGVALAVVLSLALAWHAQVGVLQRSPSGTAQRSASAKFSAHQPASSSSPSPSANATGTPAPTAPTIPSPTATAPAVHRRAVASSAHATSTAQSTAHPATATTSSAVPVTVPITVTCAYAVHGGEGKLCIHTAPYAGVTAQVTTTCASSLVAGTQTVSTATAANASGDVTWTWPVGSCAGSATARITASKQGALNSYTEYFPVQ